MRPSNFWNYAAEKVLISKMELDWTMGNILLVANWESDVGYAWWLMETYWVEISNFIEKNEGKAHLIYPKITKIPESIKNSGIITHELPFIPKNRLGRKKLRNFIIEKRIKYVYLSDHVSMSIHYLLLRRWGIKKIIIHDHTPGERKLPVGFVRFIKYVSHRIPLITADINIGATRYLTERNRNVNCIPANKTYTVPNGIVPIDLEASYRDKYRKEFNVSESSIICVSTGRATSYKGLDFLIDAAFHIINKREDKNVTFIHCGDGPQLDEFKTKTKELKISKQFLFLGRRNDVRNLLQACDIAIHPSKGEVGYCLSILEYMSAALVTFVPNRSSVCQSIRDGHTGFIYDAESIDSFSDKLEKLVGDKDLMSTVAENARREVLKNYTLQNSKTALIDILDNIL